MNYYQGRWLRALVCEVPREEVKNFLDADGISVLIKSLSDVDAQEREKEYERSRESAIDGVRVGLRRNSPHLAFTVVLTE